MPTHQIHDKLTRKLLENRPTLIALLRRHLPPEVMDKLDLTTLKDCKETAINRDWKLSQNDIVLSCQVKNKKGSYVYLLIEHQSTPDRFMPARMLHYKMNVLSKYLGGTVKREKLPNVLGLVLYHGQKPYPYAKDVFSCFEDEELAKKDMMGSMHLIDLPSMPEDKILQEVDEDTLLKLLLKHARNKDFVKKMSAIMCSHPKIFISLSLEQVKFVLEQVKFVLEYILTLGKGKPQNAETMKAAMNEMYGAPEGEKFFSLMDYFREEARQKAQQEGLQKGLKEGKHSTLAALVKKGLISQEVADDMVADTA